MRLGVRRLAEVVETGPPVLWRHPEWKDRFPAVVHGITGRGGPGAEFDFGLFGAAPVGEVLDRWRRLRTVTGMPTVVHSRQVHGARLARWHESLPAGMVVTEGADAHTTQIADVLLTVSVADCVPVFMVADSGRAVAIAHAGWRGVAAGVVETTVAGLVEGGTAAKEIWLHCGPAICGRCYEVGPEVHAAIWPAVPPPSVNTPIDLSAAIADRACRAGVSPERVSVSTHCTQCSAPDFFSHRGGSSGRQIAFIGLRR